MVATTGNTLGPPPRRTGDNEADTAALLEWVQDLYISVVVEANVIGEQSAQSSDLAALTARVAALESKMAAIAALVFLAGPIAGVYTPAQLAAAYDAINAIINAARE